MDGPLKVSPAGASTKMVAQYAQNMKSGKFRKFDYGRRENLEVYGQEEPPKYKVELVTVPITTYRGLSDFATPEEVVIYKYHNHMNGQFNNGIFEKFFSFS